MEMSGETNDTHCGHLLVHLHYLVLGERNHGNFLVDSGHRTAF